MKSWVQKMYVFLQQRMHTQISLQYPPVPLAEHPKCHPCMLMLIPIGIAHITPRNAIVTHIQLYQNRHLTQARSNSKNTTANDKNPGISRMLCKKPISTPVKPRLSTAKLFRRTCQVLVDIAVAMPTRTNNTSGRRQFPRLSATNCLRSEIISKALCA